MNAGRNSWKFKYDGSFVSLQAPVQIKLSAVRIVAEIIFIIY